ncbi:hypothetical protein [Tunicatimonas pelagia]|uniref:hypothetical protein n=1 Tax=Tunicatimonas pelagia TaxID=931531 RepID=UPI002665C7D8|nr:hypothetical protein [Tunicatimonas pelagia]WKN45262.1 hypothetical protein P0M28_09860 [Tunicatimonas pelagia]
MKTLITSFVVVFILAALPSFGQSAYQSGNFIINGGIGLGSSIYGTVSLNGSAEYFINDEVSIGGGIGYSGYSRGRYFGDPLRVSVIYVGPRGSFHLSNTLGIDNSALDVYAGVFVGYGIVSVSYRNERVWGANPYYNGYSNFNYDIFGGARYLFNENLAAYGELGFGISVLQLGITFSL